MTDHSAEQILTWLRAEKVETRIAALQSLVKSAIDIEAFWPEFPRLLHDPDPGVRWQAAALLATKAASKDIGAFVPDLESLFDDVSKPSWLGRANTSVGSIALATVARYYVHHRKHEALRALIARGGRHAVSAVQALCSTGEPDLIAPLLPDLAQAQAAPDETLSDQAAAALAHYKLLSQPADRLGELLLSDDEAVRLRVLHKLDGLAEDGSDIGPFLPGLLSLMQSRDPSFKRTREAAAKVLVWLVLAQDPRKVHEVRDFDVHIPASFILNGVDIMTFFEVRAIMEDLRRFVRTHSWE